MGSRVQDLRYTLRALRRSPGFTAVAVLTLALGIGATTAIFSVIYGVLLKPLPFHEPERLVSLLHRAAGPNFTVRNHAPATYFTYLDNHRVFEDIGVWESNQVSITGRAEPERVEALSVTDGTLPLLRVQPLLGRLFSKEDDRPGSPVRVVLTYGYWQRKFGGAPDVIGTPLNIDGTPAEIIGVLPSSFKFLRTNPAVLLPQQLDRADASGFDFQVLARLKPGVTLTQASADVARMIPLLPRWFEKLQLQPYVRPLAQHVTGDVGRILWILLATVGIVLLIACANVANLFLVRAGGTPARACRPCGAGRKWGADRAGAAVGEPPAGIRRRRGRPPPRPSQHRRAEEAGARDLAARRRDRHRPRGAALHAGHLAADRPPVRPRSHPEIRDPTLRRSRKAADRRAMARGDAGCAIRWSC